MINRRKLLANAGAAGLFSASGMGSVLSSFSAQAADSSGYKALVCVFLEGGMDHYDTILPYDQSSYNTFRGLREDLFTAYGGDAIDNSRGRENLLQLNPTNAADFGSRQFGVPSQLSPLQSLFSDGNAAIVSNVGPLLEPVTRVDYENNKNLLPPRLFSHNDQRTNWLAFNPEGARYGWGGYFADAHVFNPSDAQRMFSTISMANNSVFLWGQEVLPYQATPGGSKEFRIMTSGGIRSGLTLPTSIRSELENHLMGAGVESSSLFMRDIKSIHQSSIEANEFFNTVMGGAPDLSASFPSTSLGRQLEAVAETISMRNQFGVGRQVFYVMLPTFDTHGDQATRLPGLHAEMAEAIASFYQSTVDLGVQNDVTLFTASDFGRTLNINSRTGTDHGWGGHHFVVGGAVRGGEIYGEVPPYELGHDYDAGRGRTIPTTSVEQYAATLGKWFGLSDSELRTALPNLGSFNQTDLMFL